MSRECLRSARRLLVVLVASVVALATIAVAQLELALQTSRARTAYAEQFVDSRVGSRSLTLNRPERNGDASLAGGHVPGVGNVYVFARKVGINNKYACVVNAKDAATELAWEREIAPCFALIGNKTKDARDKSSKGLLESAQAGEGTSQASDEASGSEARVSAVDRDFAAEEGARRRAGATLPFFDIQAPPSAGGWVLTLMILVMVVTASSRVTALLESRDPFADEPWLVLDARSLPERVVAWAERIAVAVAGAVSVALQLTIILASRSLQGTESWPVLQLAALVGVLALAIAPSKNLFIGLGALKKRRRPSQRPAAQPAQQASRPTAQAQTSSPPAAGQAPAQPSVQHSSIQQRGTYAAPQPRQAPQPQQPYQRPAAQRR